MKNAGYPDTLRTKKKTILLSVFAVKWYIFTKAWKNATTIIESNEYRAWINQNNS